MLAQVGELPAQRAAITGHQASKLARAAHPVAFVWLVSNAVVDLGDVIGIDVQHARPR